MDYNVVKNKQKLKEIEETLKQEEQKSHREQAGKARGRKTPQISRR